MPHLERPQNEPTFNYEPGSSHRERLKKELDRLASQKVEIPCFVGAKQIKSGDKKKVVMPHDHQHVLAEFHLAGEAELKGAVAAAAEAKPKWESMAWEDRVSIFLKAADLLAGPYRDLINASTMLGQSKNAYQAEIDAACELVDFLKFNAYFYQEVMKVQPGSPKGFWNRSEYRPLEGFVLAITPFNFTAIAANLAAVPAMLGNTVVWKASDTQMLSAYYTLQLFREAGLPDGVINLVGADGPLVGRTLLPLRDLAGVNFTGSTATFQQIWRSVGENVQQYRSYPRLVGETGGKDFVFVHPSADAQSVVTALVRGAFEYQGQKCSAASRAYVPKGLWKTIREPLLETIRSIRMGDVRDFRNLVNAVIDRRSFEKISGFLAHAQDSNDAEILVGGKTHGEKGYFVEPTVIQATQPKYKSMVEEIFGPVLTVYVYDEAKLEETLDLCDTSTPYALTGAIFAQDRYAVEMMSRRLRHSAGNFYINDKPTGAVVGQQPFGGGRASGTNDKAGSALNLYRWLSARSIKETFDPPKDYRYPFMQSE